jgi:DNA primase
VEAEGIELRRHGTDLLGLCPFHDDREPSLVVSPKGDLWHCLGACQTGGSVIDWVMRSRGVSLAFVMRSNCRCGQAGDAGGEPN